MDLKTLMNELDLCEKRLKSALLADAPMRILADLIVQRNNLKTMIIEVLMAERAAAA